MNGRFPLQSRSSAGAPQLRNVTSRYARRKTDRGCPALTAACPVGVGRADEPPPSPWPATAREHHHDGGSSPEILGVTMLAAFFIIVANLAVDILYAVVDPRVRH